MSVTEDKKGNLNGWPVSGIIPKTEIQAQQFIDRFPTYDGRGTIVGVFDTGVDPGAAGLQVTPDGKPKVIDIIDSSGSGDVDTSTVVKASTSGTITGLSGRTLKVGSSWSNPSGNYYIGVKRAYELFPKELTSRVKASRREKWTVEHRTLEADLHRQLATKLEKKEKAEVETRLAELVSLEKSFDDPGPLYDCVVFHDGTVWRAAVDTKEAGELAGCKLLTDYRLERQYEAFSIDDMMNYSVNIYDEGRVLSIVVNAGAHGTHVAGIIGAYYPEHPESNGVAPGCQIVSVKIGDGRLGSMETGTGLERGLIAAVNTKCDMINMSYGEPSSRPDVGRFCELATELVNKHGIIFISSAGNAGPGMTTVGAPGATTSAIIGVGAYVAPSVMTPGYSLLRQVPETQYTWSSRGPSFDGALGVSISAVGGAIAPVPNWCLSKNQLMNGTSMSSPSATGAIALLVSGLKANGKSYTPYGIRRAIENSARKLTGTGLDPWSTGHGLIQTVDAYEWLEKFGQKPEQQVIFQVNAPLRQNARGIYIREAPEVFRVLETTINVTPVFPERYDETKDDSEVVSPTASSAPLSLSGLTSTPTSVRASINRQKVDLEVRLSLRSTASWVTSSSHVMVMGGGKAFTVGVDPRGLEPGAHFAEVLGFDSACPERGPLLRLPITVLVPVAVPAAVDSRESREIQAATYKFPSLSFISGQIIRKFITVPAHATWCEAIVTAKGFENRRTFMIHMGYLLPEKAHRDTSHETFFSLTGTEENTNVLNVIPGSSLEVCLAQFWSSLGETVVDLEVIFHSLVASNSTEVAIHAPKNWARVDVYSPTRVENLSPAANLSVLRQAVRPTISEIRPLRDARRNNLPNNRQVYELILTYPWEVKERASITPRAQLLQGVLYESVYGSQFWMIFDSNKNFVGSGDAFPDGVTLPKGKYTIRLQVRHDRTPLLDGLKDMVIVVDTKLSKAISVPIYATYNDLATKSGSFGSRPVEVGGRRALWLGVPDNGSFKNCNAGDLLVGSLTLGNGGPKTPQVEDKDKRVGRIALTLVVPPPPAKKSDAPAAAASGAATPAAAATIVPSASGEIKGDTPSPSAAAATPATPVAAAATPVAAAAATTETKAPEDGVDIEIRDASIDSIKGHSGEKQVRWWNELSPAMLAKWPKHLPLLSLRLAVAYGKKVKVNKDIIEAADGVINEVKQDELAAHFGLLRPSDDDEKATKKNKEFEKIKEQLLEALWRKTEATMEDIKTFDKAESKDTTERTALVASFRAALTALSRWSDRKDAKFLQLNLFEDLLDSKFGAALKKLNAGIAAVLDGGALPSKELLTSRVELFDKLGWKQWAAYDRVWVSIKYPKDFALF